MVNQIEITTTEKKTGKKFTIKYALTNNTERQAHCYCLYYYIADTENQLGH